MLLRRRFQSSPCAKTWAHGSHILCILQSSAQGAGTMPLQHPPCSMPAPLAQCMCPHVPSPAKTHMRVDLAGRLNDERDGQVTVLRHGRGWWRAGDVGCTQARASVGWAVAASSMGGLGSPHNGGWFTTRIATRPAQLSLPAISAGLAPTDTWQRSPVNGMDTRIHGLNGLNGGSTAVTKGEGWGHCVCSHAC